MSIQLSKALDKAQRLLNTEAIDELEQPRVFAVAGDHDTYLVVAAELGSGWAIHCPCPSRSPDCSHALAVRKLVNPRPSQPADPFEGIT